MKKQIGILTFILFIIVSPLISQNKVSSSKEISLPSIVISTQPYLLIFQDMNASLELPISQLSTVEFSAGMDIIENFRFEYGSIRYKYYVHVEDFEQDLWYVAGGTTYEAQQGSITLELGSFKYNIQDFTYHVDLGHVLNSKNSRFDGWIGLGYATSPLGKNNFIHFNQNSISTGNIAIRFGLSLGLIR